MPFGTSRHVSRALGRPILQACCEDLNVIQQTQHVQTKDFTPAACSMQYAIAADLSCSQLGACEAKDIADIGVSSDPEADMTGGSASGFTSHQGCTRRLIGRGLSASSTSNGEI